MKNRAIPWRWLLLSFLGYGMIGFSCAALLLIFSLPFVISFPVSIVLTLLVALVLSFAAPVGTALMIMMTVALSAGLVVLATYFWNYVLYFWSHSILRSLYWLALLLASGLIWLGISALVRARNKLVKSFRKPYTFLVLAATSSLGLIAGWLIGRYVFP